VQQADLTGLSDIKPLLLIGQDNYALIVSKDVIQVEVNAPILSRNKLGWVLHGPAEFPNNAAEAIVNLCCERDDEKLHQLGQDHYKMLVLLSEKSEEDRAVVKKIESSIKKIGKH
jgi:hypothetical protein